MAGEWKLDRLCEHLNISFFWSVSKEVSEGFNAAGAMVDLHYGEITLNAM